MLLESLHLCGALIVSMLFTLLWLMKVRSGPFDRSSPYYWAAPKSSCQLGRASAGNHLHWPQEAPLFCSLYSHTEDVLAAAEHQIVTAGRNSFQTWQLALQNHKQEDSTNFRWPCLTCAYSATSRWRTFPLVAQQRTCDWCKHNLHLQEGLYHNCDWWEPLCQSLYASPLLQKQVVRLTFHAGERILSCAAPWYHKGRLIESFSPGFLASLIWSFIVGRWLGC